MRLANPSKLLKLWQRARDQKANVVLMRHAPKSDSDNSELSEEGKRLAVEYGHILRADIYFWQKYPRLIGTSKNRTAGTLKLMFPLSNPLDYPYLADLDVNKVSPDVQRQCDELHEKIGRFRGYYLNHTYYFLEKLGGRFDEENPHTVVAERMARGIRSLLDSGLPTIYCGHSPAIEVGVMKLLGLSLSELGGFLNPLDSIHLKINELNNRKAEWVVRINPIADYVDLESETYFSEK